MVIQVSIVSAGTIKPEKVSWQEQEYKQVKSMREVPVKVLTSLLLKMPSDRRMADRNAKYNSTGKADSKLAQRRFMLAGVSSQFVLIVYEHGSRPFHQHLAVFSVRNKKPLLVYVAKSTYSLTSIKEIKKLVKNGTLKNQIKEKRLEW